MNTFVILAAGRGSRMGRIGNSLHKALVPLERKAVLSHIIDLVPHDERIVIATGYKESQVKEYVGLAHPGDERIRFVSVTGWDREGGGPGASLMKVYDADEIEGNLTFTSCDTLWTPSLDPDIGGNDTWMGVAPMPAGTAHDRWCRVATRSKFASHIIDKSHDSPGVLTTWVGLGHVNEADRALFFEGIVNHAIIAGERQMTMGFQELIDAERPVKIKNVLHWTDIGDDEAYRRAVAERDGYDFIKPGQATYILPRQDRVIKFNEQGTAVRNRMLRGFQLEGCVPKLIKQAGSFLAYEYAEGVTIYRAIRMGDIDAPYNVVEWYKRNFLEQRPLGVLQSTVYYAADKFYRDKTLQRVSQLRPELRDVARSAVSRVDWRELVRGTRPGKWHGDLNFANLIVDVHDITAIDWREDFGHLIEWGDQRYDVAKLVAGCRVDWSAAQRGDLRPPRLGDIECYLRANLPWDYWTEVIAALTLINSAPLHAAPFDEVLVARGTKWLGDLM